MYKENDMMQQHGVFEQNLMLNGLLNEIPGGVAVFKITDRLICQYFSDGFAKISGRSREEIELLQENNMLLKTVIAPSDYYLVLNTVMAKKNLGQPINLTFRYTIKAGGIGWLHLAATKLREEDGAPVYYCIFTNPSEETSLYRSVVEDSANGVFVAERKSRRVLYINDTIRRMFNIPREVIRQRIDNSENISPQFVFLTQEDIHSLKEDSYTEFHVVWQNKLHLSIQAKALNWNGVDAYIMLFTDETAEHKHQAELQKLIDEVPAGIGIYEVHGGKICLSYLNEAYYGLLGVDKENQYPPEKLQENIAPEDIHVVDEGFQKLIEGMDKINVLYRIRNFSGKWIWISMAASVMERKKDYLKVYAAFTDCDEMVRTQKELQENRIMLNAALDSAKVMEWRYDFNNHVITDSGALGKTYHMPKVIENIPDVFMCSEIIRWICQESLDDFFWLFDHCGEGKRIQRDVHCMTPDGRKKIWKRVIYTPIFDKAGKCVESIGTAVDITEQKEREQNYEEQLRLKKIIAKNALAVATYNLNQNTVLEMECQDDVLEKIKLCKTVDELQQWIYTNTINMDEKSKMMEIKDCSAMRKTFEEGKNHIEIFHQLKNDIRWMQSTFDMITNPYTDEVEVIAVLRDITEAVRAELVVNRLLSVDYESIMTMDAETGAVLPFKHRETVSTFLDEDRMYTKENFAFIKEQLEIHPIYESLYAFQEENRTKYKRAVYVYLDESRNLILGAIQNVTETYEQEEEQKKALTKALKTAEEASRFKSDFLSRMSHDMRTPMNGILGMAELSLTENNVDTLKKNMEQIKESGDYLLSLINDTLDFQRIESGKMELNNQIIYTTEVFQSMVDLIRPAAEEKNIEFTIVNHNADMNWYILIDPVRIKQIFLNLLSNAVKFTPEGGKIIMDIENLSREGLISHNCIKIIDTGIGMSQSFMEKYLFKPFVQEQNEVSTQYVGSGLGLSIARSLVELMGGHIEVESELGSGTTFTVYLDFHRVDEEEAKRAKEKEKSMQFTIREELVGVNILLVEDHPLNAQIAINLLQRVGCTVDWKRDGQKGVQAFADSRIHEYDAVLMDIRMPIMNGLEAARAIRKLDREDAAAVPIIAMTANTYDEDVKKSLDAGMDAHLAKPIESGKLYKTLVEWIQTK